MDLRIASVIVAHFLAPSVSASGEQPFAYHARIDIIGESVADAAEGAHLLGWRGSRVQMAAALLVLVDEESRFDERVHAGSRHPVWTADHGRSTCLMQVQRSRYVQGWEHLAGIDSTSTFHCLSAGARLFSAQYHSCSQWPVSQDSMALAFTAYGVGHCGPPSQLGKDRAAKWARILRRLEQAGKTPS